MNLCHRTSYELNNYALFLFTSCRYTIDKYFNYFFIFLSSFLVAESAAVSRGFCFFRIFFPHPGKLGSEVTQVILSYIRTVLLYLVLIFGVRLMGKRQIGQMEASEFVVTMLVANLASIPMQDGGIPLFSGLVPILTVLGMELVFSGLILRSIGFRKLLCGKPVILIDNGKILQDNLRATRVTLDELTSHLRQKDVMDLKSVQYAILETDGNLSVFPYPKDQPAPAGAAGIRVRDQLLPITVIEDGYFSRENLVKARRDRKWLERVLEEHRADIAGTFLLTVDEKGHVIWIGKEGG